MNENKQVSARSTMKLGGHNFYVSVRAHFFPIFFMIFGYFGMVFVVYIVY